MLPSAELACDLEEPSLFYTYSVTGGQLTGDGAEVIWDLSGATSAADYTVTVEVDDGCGCISSASAQVKVRF